MFKIGNLKEYVTYSNMPLFLKKRKTSFSREAVVKRWFWPELPFVSPAVWVTSTICPFCLHTGLQCLSGGGGVCGGKPVTLLPYDQIVSSLCAYFISELLS